MECSTGVFALVSVAASIRQKDGKVEQACIAMGGVAPIPWRSREAEAALVGKPLNETSVSEAAEQAMKSARPLRDNAYQDRPRPRHHPRRVPAPGVTSPLLAGITIQFSVREQSRISGEKFI